MSSSHYRTGRTGRHRRQRAGRPVSCNHDNGIIQLRQWMKTAAQFSSHLEPALFKETGRGLRTRKPVCRGDTVVSIPHSLLITSRTVLRSDIGNFIKAWEPKLTAQQCLSVFLIWERHKLQQSNWHPFISVLPTSYTTPAYFSTLELQLLPTSVREAAVTSRNKVRTMYEGVVEFSRYSWDTLYRILNYETFNWAWNAINTRSVYYEPERSAYLSYDDPDNIALAPFLDLLNHSPNANVKAGFNVKNNCYEIATYDTYNAYEQVFISYGSHGNHKLFLEYGFCVPENHHDAFEFTYDDIVEACRHFKVQNVERKFAILRENKLLQGLSCSMDGLSWKLWTSLKTLAMSWDQLQKWTDIYQDEKKFDDTITMATLIAKYLLQKYILQNKHQEKQALQHVSSPHVTSEHMDIVLTLIRIEKDILTASLKQL